MSMHDQAFRTVELPALPGKLGEIDALLQAARSSGTATGERAVLKEIARNIDRSSGGTSIRSRSAERWHRDVSRAMFKTRHNLEKQT